VVRPGLVLPRSAPNPKLPLPDPFEDPVPLLLRVWLGPLHLDPGPAEDRERVLFDQLVVHRVADHRAKRRPDHVLDGLLRETSRTKLDTKILEMEARELA
jgi:hypothetical protein